MFNPHAAAARAGRLLGPVREALGRFAEVDLHRTEARGDARAWLADADLSVYDAVLAAGGDGTLFETVNGLYANAVAKPPLGVIPVGTGNAFARDLGLMPGDWRKGVNIVASGRTRAFDVGHVDSASGSYHFMNIAGAGLPVDVMMSPMRMKIFGRATYSVASLWKALQMNCRPLKIWIDGELVERDSLFVEVSNTRFTGTSFMIAPGAEPDDGLLDVTLVGRLPRLRVLKLFPSVYKGEHIHFEEVDSYRGKEIRIESPAPLPLAADGELEGKGPVTIRCLHRDIEVLTA